MRRFLPLAILLCGFAAHGATPAPPPPPKCQPASDCYYWASTTAGSQSCHNLTTAFVGGKNIPEDYPVPIARAPDLCPKLDTYDVPPGRISNCIVANTGDQGTSIACDGNSLKSVP